MSKPEIHTGNHDRLITHIERVAGKAKNSKFSPAIMKNTGHSLERIAAFLECNNMQAFLFSVILALNFKNQTVNLSDMAEFMNCDPLLMANYLLDFGILESKRLIRRESEGKRRKAMVSDISFYITREVLDSIYRGEKTGINQKSLKTMADLLVSTNELMEDRQQGMLSYEEMHDDIAFLLEAAKDLDFTRRLKGQDLPDYEQAMMLLICYETLLGNAEVELSQACERIFGEMNLSFQYKRALVRGDAIITHEKLVKLADGFFRSDRFVMLTEKGLETFFGEDMDVVVKKQDKLMNGIRPEMIAEKQLFFNEQERKEMDMLQSLLSDTGYRKVCERLRNSNLRTGFTVLLHGMPGTGKTEAVYQLARITRRTILNVNISECKDKWYGESEKIARQIFENYRDRWQASTTDPILLLNEADGILARRKELGSAAVDQTENAIQNILLQEMEDFKGILIATTNLTINLDKAFERRFLYKIRFENPDPEVKAMIWQNKLPQLAGAEAEDLARRFDLTGGQIENVARKYATEEVISGRVPDLARIMEFCLKEKLEQERKSNIGFRR
jgi:SpoVK/Ycf46/Vps4 family AAA+-type ATPase